MTPEMPPDGFLNRPLVYVAAPYTHPDPVENTHLLIHAVDQIAHEGVVTPLAPHLTLLWHMVRPHPLDFWYAYDLAALARCDALLRLPGPSTGADRELEFASDRGIPVFTEKSALYAWVASLREQNRSSG
jgi:hypothetical protein